MYLSWCVPIPSTQSCLKLVFARRLWPNGPQGIRSFRCGWWFQIFSSIAWTDDDDDDKNAVSIFMQLMMVDDGWWWLMMMVVMMMMIMMMMMVIMTMKPTKCSIAWRSWLTEKYFSGAWHKQAEHAPGASGFECWMVVDAQHTFGEPGGKWKTPDMLNHCVTFLEQTNCKTNNTSGNYRCKIHHVTSIPLFFLNGYFPCFIHMFIHYIYVNKDNYIYNYIYIHLNGSDIVHQAQELLSSFQVFDAEGTGPLVFDLGTGWGPWYALSLVIIVYLSDINRFNYLYIYIYVCTQHGCIYASCAAWMW